tara:strand:- start:439 stop:906 length:468 start_codon:yes stop_codon:yes gene_type:complete
MESEKNQAHSNIGYSTKSQLYAREQAYLIAKMFAILELDQYNSIIKKSFDEDIDKQNEIIQLLPELRKYFSISVLHHFIVSEKCKRKAWTIVKTILKDKPVEIISKPTSYMLDGKQKRTQRYTFIFQNDWLPDYKLLTQSAQVPREIIGKWKVRN